MVGSAVVAAGPIAAWLSARNWLDIIVGVGIGILNADAARAVWKAARAKTDPTP